MSAPKVGEGSEGDPQDVADIARTLRMAAAAVGREVEGVVGMFQDDAGTVFFDYTSPDLLTLSDLRDTARDLAENARDVVCTYPEVTVRVLSKDFAYSIADSFVAATMQDGSKMEITSRVTDIWQRIDGRWQAIHEHGSVPIDMATGMAILDRAK